MNVRFVSAEQHEEFDHYMFEHKTGMSTRDVTVTVDHETKEVSGECVAFGGWRDLEYEVSVAYLHTLQKEQVLRGFESKEIVLGSENEIKAWISKESGRVGVVGVLNICRINGEDEVLCLDITDSSETNSFEEYWIDLMNLENNFVDNYPIYEVFNVESYKEYLNSNMVQEKSVFEHDFNPDFIREVQGIFKGKEKLFDQQKVSRKNKGYER